MLVCLMPNHWHDVMMQVAFPSLEILTLSRLNNLQLIWNNQLHEDSFRTLKLLTIQFCGKLMTIVPSNIQGLLTFQNLEALFVDNCWSMKNLFPVSVATNLAQLNDLRLESCGLEEIVAFEKVDGVLTFCLPQLKSVTLCILPELKCFYCGLHTTEWPMLKSLVVYHCHNIKIFASGSPSFQKGDEESQLENPFRQHLFLLEKVWLTILFELQHIN